MKRAAVLLALTLAFAAPGQAGAGILAPEDATEAANALAEAQAEQGVCYGWTITNDFDGQPDVGSSMSGPGQPPDFSQCRQYVHLTGNIHYACESCEGTDTADVSIDSNLSPAPSEDDFRALGLEALDLTGDNDDVTLVNMIQALPLLAAERGGVAPLPAETPQSVPASDTPTNRPGSDFMRESWLEVLFFVFLIGAGAVLWWYRRDQERRENERQRRRQERIQEPPRTQEPKGV